MLQTRTILTGAKLVKSASWVQTSAPWTKAVAAIKDTGGWRAHRVVGADGATASLACHVLPTTKLGALARPQRHFPRPPSGRTGLVLPAELEERRERRAIRERRRRAVTRVGSERRRLPELWDELPVGRVVTEHLVLPLVTNSTTSSLEPVAHAGALETVNPPTSEVLVFSTVPAKTSNFSGMVRPSFGDVPYLVVQVAAWS